MLGEAERSQTTMRTYRTGRADARVQDGFQHGVGIDVEQRRFGTEGDHAGRWLVLGMAREVGIAVGAGNAAEERHVRPRRGDQQHQRGRQRGEQDAVQDAEQQHG